MYEKATAVEPENEELLTHLFMSYVRLDKFKEQQTAAMKLYRVTGKNPYLFWGVMSLVLQANREGLDNKMTMKLTLPLAEKMVVRHAEEGKMEQEHEVHMYLMVFEMQDKYKEALAFLEGPICHRLLANSIYHDYVDSQRVKYLRELERWSQLNVATKDLIRKSPDQWSLYQDYITSALKAGEGQATFAAQSESGSNSNSSSVAGSIGNSSSSSSSSMSNTSTSSGADDTMEKIGEFLDEMKESAGDTSSLRGPFLAEIEFKARLLEAKIKHSYWDPG